MTQIYAYVRFPGNCREAMRFYRDALGGELMLQTVAESPMAGQMPPEAQEQIIHARLTRDALVLMASDMMQGAPVHGNSIALLLYCSSEAEIRSCFANLSVGGTVCFPLSEQPWGAIFGELTDRYGVNWMLNFDKPQAT